MSKLPTSQEKIAQTSYPESNKDTVWVVVYRRMDDPHPQCEGVYDRKSDAKEAMKRCESSWDEPKDAVAWSKFEQEIQE